jgi:hypothetical protein
MNNFIVETHEQFLGIIRHTLTFIGGLLVMNGITTEAVAMEIVGAVMTAIGGIWSVLQKRK